MFVSQAPQENVFKLGSRSARKEMGEAVAKLGGVIKEETTDDALLGNGVDEEVDTYVKKDYDSDGKERRSYSSLRKETLLGAAMKWLIGGTGNTKMEESLRLGGQEVEAKPGVATPKALVSEEPVAERVEGAK